MELNKKQVIILGISASLISMLVMTIVFRQLFQVVRVTEQEQKQIEVEQFMERFEDVK